MVIGTIVISTRRFCARPASVSFDATGCDSPAPTVINRWSLELGGHCRTGLEDNVRLDRDRLAPSNAALVERIVALCPEYGRRPATAAEARALLRLPEGA